MQAEVFSAHIMAAGRGVVVIVVSHDGSLAHSLRQAIANQ
jgi:predicted transcriptional regulator